MVVHKKYAVFLVGVVVGVAMVLRISQTKER